MMSTKVPSVCRTCLVQESKLFSIFSSEGSQQVADMIGFITNMTPSTSDGMPESVCEVCFANLKSFYLFKIKCLTSHYKLSYKLKSSKESQDGLITHEFSEKELIVNSNEETNLSDLSNDFNIEAEMEQEVSNIAFTNVIQENEIEIKDEVYGESSDEESEESNEKPSEHRIQYEECSEKNTTDQQLLSVYLVEQSANQKSIELEVRCPVCSKGYQHLSGLEEHMKTHSSKQPHSSSAESEPSKEDEQTPSPMSKNQEVTDTLNESKKGQLRKVQQEFQCTQGCTKVFKSRSVLTRHMKIHSRGEKPNYVCDICSRSFTKICHLKNHTLNEHIKSKIFKCEQCNQLFPRKSSLTRHSRVHTGDRPFVCEICNKGFPHAFTLEAHKRVHSEERPFKCDICPNQFKCPQSLKEHRRKHIDERTLSCQMCPKKFSSKVQFEIHMKTHEKEIFGNEVRESSTTEA